MIGDASEVPPYVSFSNGPTARVESSVIGRMPIANPVYGSASAARSGETRLPPARDVGTTPFW